MGSRLKFDNVVLRGDPPCEGYLKLQTVGLVFRGSAPNGEDDTTIKVRWTNLARPRAIRPQAGSDDGCRYLKLTRKDPIQTWRLEFSDRRQVLTAKRSIDHHIGSSAAAASGLDDSFTSRRDSDFVRASALGPALLEGNESESELWDLSHSDHHHGNEGTRRRASTDTTPSVELRRAQHGCNNKDEEDVASYVPRALRNADSATAPRIEEAQGPEDDVEAPQARRNGTEVPVVVEVASAEEEPEVTVPGEGAGSTHEDDGSSTRSGSSDATTTKAEEESANPFSPRFSWPCLGRSLWGSFREVIAEHVLFGIFFASTEKTRDFTRFERFLVFLGFVGVEIFVLEVLLPGQLRDRWTCDCIHGSHVNKQHCDMDCYTMGDSGGELPGEWWNSTQRGFAVVRTVAGLSIVNGTELLCPVNSTKEECSVAKACCHAAMIATGEGSNRMTFDDPCPPHIVVQTITNSLLATIIPLACFGPFVVHLLSKGHAWSSFENVLAYALVGFQVLLGVGGFFGGLAETSNNLGYGGSSYTLLLYPLFWGICIVSVFYDTLFSVFFAILAYLHRNYCGGKKEAGENEEGSDNDDGSEKPDGQVPEWLSNCRCLGFKEIGRAHV